MPGKEVVKCGGGVPTGTFPSVVGRNLIESEKTGAGAGVKIQTCFMSRYIDSGIIMCP